MTFRRISSALLTVAALTVGLSSCGGSHHHSHSTSTQSSKPSPTTPHASGQKIYRTKYGISAHSPTFGLPPVSLSHIPKATGIPTKLMLDTTNPDVISGLSFGALAGYTAGYWPSYFRLAVLYPRAILKSIAISTVYHAYCLDIEPGDAVPSQAGPWVLADRRAGFKRPCEYSSLSEMPAVKQNLAAWHIPLSSVSLWDANWTYTPHLDAGYAATQWTNHYANRNIDASLVTYGFIGLPIKPNPPKTPVCFGKHPQLRNHTCVVVRKEDAVWARSSASSTRAYSARGCPVLAQRISWFGSRLHGPKKAYRTAALAASRTAYRRQNCAVFAQRVSYFNGRRLSVRKQYR